MTLKNALCGLLIQHNNELITKYFKSCSLFSPEGKVTTCSLHFYLDILVFPGVKKFVWFSSFAFKVKMFYRAGFMALRGILNFGVRSNDCFYNCFRDAE